MKKEPYLVSSLLVTIAGVYLHAWALTWLWVWFAVPQFGVAVLTLKAALGLMFIRALFTRANPKPEPTTDDERATRLSESIAACVAAPLLVLFVGLMIFKLMN